HGRRVLDEPSVDDELGQSRPGKLELKMTKETLTHGHETARSGFFEGGLGRNLLERFIGETGLNAVGFELPLILADEAALGVLHDVVEIPRLEMITDDPHGESTDNLGFEAEFDEVLRARLFALLRGGGRFGVGRKSDRTLAKAAVDDFLQSRECPAYD